ncbi:GRIM-19, partial [Mucidula mucida]
LPPPGGFEAIKYRRNLPFRGPGALTILAGVTAISAFGFYKLGMGNIEKRELQREKVWSRIHLIPLLLAEADRAAYHLRLSDMALEAAIMKDVPGWE